MSFYADDYEPCSFYKHTIVRARKAHRCDACKRQIAPGHRYALVKLAGDGSAETIKRCGACERIYQHLSGKGAARGMQPQERLDCGETYEDEWDEPPPDDIAALAFMTDDDAGAALQPKHAVHLFVPTGDHHDRQRAQGAVAPRTQPTTKIQAVTVG